MVNDLVILCLDKIALNLHLNYQLFKTSSFKLPQKLGEKIYENSFSVKSRFTENDVKFFNKEIMDLKIVDLSRKQFKDLNYFDFLNGHELDYFNITENIKFQLKSKEKKFNLTIKDGHLHISMLNFHENWNNLFQNCKIIESVAIYLIDEDCIQNSKLIFNCFGEFIQNIDLYYSKLATEKFLKFVNCLEDKKSIKRLNIPSGDLNIQYLNSIQKKSSYQYIWNTLEELRISALYDDTSSTIIFLIKQLKNLKSFSCHMPNNEIEAIRILRTLEEFNSEKLEVLDLNFEEKTELIDSALAQLLSKCCRLVKLNLFCMGGHKYCFGQKIIHSLHTCAANLECLDLTSLYQTLDDYWTDWENLMLKFSSLKTIYLFYHMSSKLDKEKFNKFLEVIKLKVEKLWIRYDDSTKFLMDNICFKNFNRLQKVELTAFTCENDSITNIVNSLIAGNCWRTIRSFKISDCKIDDYSAKEFTKFLTLCKNLEKLSLQVVQMLNQSFSIIFNSLYHLKDTLKSLKVSYSDLNDVNAQKLVEFLRECRFIEKITVYEGIIHLNVLFNLLQSLKSSKKCLKTVYLQQCEMDVFEREKVAELAKTFHSADLYLWEQF